ncbi:hypothetical protein [Aureimonas mangrovi]|uniref:hypothetical protein n=1 Tax=Aureimonas mangrovi TaxID=2758041 RepID=UPI00163D86AF|nr:hypothetical protein [Aureimonas mangrovi]
MKLLAGDWKSEINVLLNNREFAFQNSLLKFERIALEEVAEFDVVTEENKASIAGKLGWGALGAIALGPLGLLAGVLGGGNRQERIISVSFKDGRKALLKGTSKEVQILTASTFK